MFFKKKGMAPEEKGMVRRHAKTGWGKHYRSVNLYVSQGVWVMGVYLRTLKIWRNRYDN